MGNVSLVCAIKHRWDPKEHKIVGVDQVIPIVSGDEKAIAWEAKRLPGDDKAAKDGKKEGLRLTLGGGSTYQRRAQRAVVEFRCNPDLVGTEDEWESIDKYVPAADEKKGGGSRKRDGEGDKKGDESTPEQQLRKDGAALVWDGYRRERDADGADMDTLYLTWYTKHACDAAVDEPSGGGGGGETSHWGFFTWFYVM